MLVEKATQLLKHTTIEEDLVTEIKSGRLEVGKQIPTGRLISQKYGVSLGQVRLTSCKWK